MFNQLLQFYLNLSIKIKIALLAFCYSAGLIGIGILGHYQFDPKILSGCVAVYILAGAFFTCLIMRSITVPLQQVSVAALAIGSGDLGKRKKPQHSSKVNGVCLTCLWSGVLASFCPYFLPVNNSSVR